jgi:hypothetical protein
MGVIRQTKRRVSAGAGDPITGLKWSRRTTDKIAMALGSGLEVWVAEHIRKEQACPSPSISQAKQVPAKQGN